MTQPLRRRLRSAATDGTPTLILRGVLLLMLPLLALELPFGALPV